MAAREPRGTTGKILVTYDDHGFTAQWHHVKRIIHFAHDVT